MEETEDTKTWSFKKLLSDLKNQLKGESKKAELENICDNFLGKAVHLWTTGQLSNFDYILLLNHLSGRTFSNPNHYPGRVNTFVEFQEHEKTGEIRTLYE